MDRFWEKFWVKIASKLPRSLVKWAAIRLMVNATAGEYSGQVMPGLTALDALKRW